MDEIALVESDRIIKEKTLKVQLKQVTSSGIRSLLDPTTIAEKLQTLTPFTYGYLLAFAASPNRYRQRAKFARDSKHKTPSETPASLDAEESEAEDQSGDGQSGGEALEGVAWEKEFPGFSRNPTTVSVVRAGSRIMMCPKHHTLCRQLSRLS